MYLLVVAQTSSELTKKVNEMIKEDGGLLEG
jgi:hypothetical protein